MRPRPRKTRWPSKKARKDDHAEKSIDKLVLNLKVAIDEEPKEDRLKGV